MQSSTLEFVDVEECLRRNISPPDVYLLPEYGQIVQSSEDGVWEMSILRFSDATCYYVYLKRPIYSEGLSTARAYFDLVSPYGYGGPWAEGEISKEKWVVFRSLFAEAARNRNYITEFIRFSPLLDDRQQLFRSATEQMVTYWFHQQTVAVDLRAGPYLTKAGKRHKYAVNVARRKGYVVRVEHGSSIRSCSLLAFKELYKETMERLCARSYYHFSDEYYSTLIEVLQDRVILCTVESEHAVVAAGFFLEYEELVHYHLSATSEEGRLHGATDIMLNEIARRAQGKGMSTFHLGGGLKQGDGLFNFKKSIGRVRMDWFLGKYIFDPEKYEQLVQERASKLKVDVQTLVDTHHFPEYRAEPKQTEASG
mmetsp:Transcript_19263/g.48139  ORF Transcript_19263/g.48139 Transcript_19263/m.48139 type:complete len:367 (+) Transcript_19263:412-1512(+)|eukprot:CAMPEP_0197608730 /NCGR_PEP_ID=MMETSP1326-20131121/49731_1 /TAXON_ID=1155430 /ORGANISM="Genus nov. species nov., Strain RCC2288" /LENGTH=366 /DNA_ID=CAMNT_0043176997 /DNA_START=364 /DNA_END=1464 /DNA_ORIENTATION=+